ncbi:glutathione S-transferase [Ideonella livida]|uniref:glutathione transferase n=1 Tax=Ideonella livida TaxID=2707176 RepID=A0A7C9PE98_9BURK|nr:glutathione S-transferase [Ideonella livida]NDY89636.1 glutathione S-transferase [Ideonella livida]
MITVHHLENSRSQRVLWLLEELGLPYEVKRYARDRVTLLAPPELTQVHPLGKSPVITDSAAGVTVAETGAIVEYLLDLAPQAGLRPTPASVDFLRYRYWLHFAEGSAMPPLLLKLIFDRVANAPMPFFIKPIAKGISAKVLGAFVSPNLQRQLDFMEAELAQRPWFAGQAFTGADVMMSFPLEAAAQRAGLTGARYPALQRWLDAVHARPAYRRALERGGPYSFAD